MYFLMKIMRLWYFPDPRHENSGNSSIQEVQKRGETRT